MDSSDDDFEEFDLFMESDEMIQIINHEIENMMPELFNDTTKKQQEMKPKKKKKKRKRLTKIDLYNTEWMLALKNPEINDEYSPVATTFRRRFRIPFIIFNDWIVPICKQYNIFNIKEETKVKVPIEMKVMIALRILGRGNCADDIQEMSKVPCSTIHVIFKTFVRNFSLHAYPLFVKIPTGDRLQQTLSCYNQLGFPGCVGCVDGTQVVWFRSPRIDTIINTGKEHEPTLGFLVVVDHGRYIMYVSTWFHGSANDISKIKNDPTMRACMQGQLADIEYTMFTKNGLLQRYN